MASIEIKWDGLLQVAGVSLAFAVGVAVVFTVGVLGLSRVEAASDETDRAGSGGRGAGLALAGVAFAACAAAVLYGLYLLIPQFH